MKSDLEVEMAVADGGDMAEEGVIGVGIGGEGTRVRSAVGEDIGGCSCVGVDGKDEECVCSFMSCQEAIVEMTRMGNMVSVRGLGVECDWEDYKEEGRRERM